jgi:hypothetical protein
MRKTKTVTIKAETLEEARSRVKKFSEGEKLSAEETQGLIDAAEAESPGRDEGKQYRLTEMDVFAAEKWALRTLLSLAKAGLDVPSGGGMQALASLGLGVLLSWLPRIPWSELEPLLDDMMGCIQMETPSGVIRKLMPGDIEEVGTLLLLRKEILALHFDFFMGAGS